ncbi:hypothetical protein B0A48_01874 [Cryoendolithus antarcticus]|uniref:USP domain-containing protein n=1 Tax=Cryoendolithus antarcticus TaxID=1507870 RepID=A0A1V8TQN3_9PEZI|nr:hypothetical protein B0A48_01874 [Cryoendolithus antarcticus]
MALANKSPSPSASVATPERNHAADSDDSLARKRQRMSEETDPVIEVFDPENIDTDAGNAVVIEDDDDDDDEMATTNFSDTLDILPNYVSVDRQLMALVEWLDSTHYDHPHAFVKFTEWLYAHVVNTEHDPRTWKLRYVQEERFFGWIADVVLKFFDATDLFEPDTLDKTRILELRHHVAQMFDALAQLSIRMVSLLPGILDGVMARRDSVRPPDAGQQQLLLGAYVTILARLLDPLTTVGRYLRFNRIIDMAEVRGNTLHKLLCSATSNVTSLNTVLLVLSSGPREFTDPWPIISSAITVSVEIMKHAGDAFQAGESRSQVEELLKSVNTFVVPTICQKHPRALPSDFHVRLIHQITALLSIAIKPRSMESALRLYHVCCSPTLEADSEAASTTSVAWKVQDISDGDLPTLSELVMYEWLLHVLKGYVSTDILDIRSKGIVALTETLKAAHAAHHANPSHPVLQHLARLLRTGNFIGYIFSVDSHASLVKECASVVAFLAATNTYTDHETDVIWRACTTSVEAEFVKASFDVLQEMLKYVATDQIVYMLNKYPDTSASDLGSHALRFFVDALYCLRTKVEYVGSPTVRMEPPNICYAVLKRLNSDPPSESRTLLRLAAVDQIRTLTVPPYSLADRTRFYETWIKSITDNDEHATSSLDILLQFLEPPTPEEGKLILEMISVDSALEVLTAFVSKSSEAQLGCFSPREAINVRLDVLLHLIGLVEDYQAPDLEERLWSYTIGDRALNSQAREDALNLFTCTSKATCHPESITALFERCIEKYLPQLSAEHATPGLITFLENRVLTHHQNLSVGEPDIVFGTVCWQQLMRFALTTPNLVVSSAAVAAISQFLFSKTTRDAVVPDVTLYTARQADWTRRLINTLPDLRASASDKSSDLLLQRSVGLLETIHYHSIAAGQRAPGGSTHVLLGGGVSDESITFTTDIFGPQSHPKKKVIKARKDCTIGELDNFLRSLTGTMEHNLVRHSTKTCLSDITAQTLEEAAIGNKALINIQPRYTYECDFVKVFAAGNAVEEEILLNFSELEALLGASSGVAQKVFDFLSRVPPPAKKRHQVTDPTIPITALFPAVKPWYTMYSVHTLTVHLKDCNKVGVADPRFIMHGCRVLAELLFVDFQELSSDLLFRLLPGLLGFLQERPPNSPPPPYLTEPTRLAMRLLDIMRVTLDAMPARTIAARPAHHVSLVKLAYTVLIQVARTENIWQHIVDTQEFVDVHATLLLCSDVNVSSEVATLMRDFCKEDPVTVSGAYLRTVRTLLPKALITDAITHPFFGACHDAMLSAYGSTPEEVDVRELIEVLTIQVWQYEHSETPDLPIADFTFNNLLELLSGAIDILKSFKKPLALERLALDLVRCLLFPSPDEASSADADPGGRRALPVPGLALRGQPSTSAENVGNDPERHATSPDVTQVIPQVRPLFNIGSRAFALEIVRKTIASADDYSWLLRRLTAVLEGTGRDSGMFPHDTWIRNPTAPAGLSNLGMTCYMNSLLQQLYANIYFRKFIIDMTISDPAKQGLLCQLKQLFAQLQIEDIPQVETYHLAKYLGVSTDVQDDVHGFYTELLSRLESEMPTAEAKTQLSQLFSGTLITQIQGSCGHVSSRKETFSDLSLTVQNKSTLAESFAEFVQGEPMRGANKYKCMSCDNASGGKLVDAMKRTCVEQAPDHLTICLKRFTYDMLGQESKINDHFEFPEEIDLAQYQRAHLEDKVATIPPDVFKLVGVIVHAGVLSFGHYWSYVRVRGYEVSHMPRWVRLEDHQAREAGGFQEVQNECFGGQDRTHNGYVLFYQRATSMEQAYQLRAPDRCSPTMRDFVIPLVQLPDELAKNVRASNKWRHSIFQVFNGEFHNLAISICKEVDSRVLAPAADDALEGSPTSASSRRDTEERRVPSGIDRELARFIFAYLVHVLFTEKEPDKLKELLAVLKQSQPCIAREVLVFICDDDDFFPQIMKMIALGHLTTIRELLKHCIGQVRDHYREEYPMVLKRIVESHSRIISTSLDAFYGKWLDFFSIAYDIAMMGSEELALIVNSKYCAYIFEVMVVPNHQGMRNRHLALFAAMKKRKVTMRPLFEFLSCVFSIPELFADLDDYEDGGKYRGAQQLVKVVNMGRDSILPWMLAATDDGYEYDNVDTHHGAKLVRTLCASGCDWRIGEAVQHSLLTCVRSGRALTQSLYFMLAACARTIGEGQDATVLMTNLFEEVLNSEPVPRKDMLDFLRLVNPVIPSTVLDTFPSWVKDWLNPASRSAKRTESWLKEHVFDATPLTVEGEVAGSTLDVQRANEIRGFSIDCARLLLNIAAAGSEERSRWTAMLNALQESHGYLRRLVNTCRRYREHTVRNHEGNLVRLSDEMDITQEEAKAAVRELATALKDLNEWDLGGMVEDEEDAFEESTDEFVTEDE